MRDAVARRVAASVITAIDDAVVQLPRHGATAVRLALGATEGDAVGADGIRPLPTKCVSGHWHMSARLILWV